MGISKHTGEHLNICGGVQTYGGHPNKQGGTQTYGASKCMGAYGHPLSLDKACFLCVVYVQGANKHHQNIQGASKHMGDVQKHRRHPNM